MAIRRKTGNLLNEYMAPTACLKILTLVLLLVSEFANAQVYFNKNYTSGLGAFWVHEVNGYYYSAFYKDQPQLSVGADYLFGKFNLQGDLVDSLILSAPDTNLNPSVISIMDQGNIITTATKYWRDSTIQGEYRRQLMLISFNPQLMDTNWIRYYGDSSVYYWDHFLYRSPYSNHFFLAGTEIPWQNFGLIRKVHLMKVDSLGMLVWHKTYPSSATELCRGISEKANGDLVLSCGRIEQAQFVDSIVQFFRIVDSSGQIKQEIKHLEQSPQYFTCSFTERQVPGQDMEYVLANQIDTLYNSIGYHYRYMAIWGMDSNLNLKWRMHLDTNKLYTESSAWLLRAFPDGKFLVGGLFWLSTHFYIWAALYKSNNELEWSHSYYHRVGGDHYPFDVIRTSDGGYLFSGVTNSTGPQNTQDAWLLKVDSNGCIDPLNCSPLNAPDWTMDEKPMQAYPNPTTSEIYFEQERLGDMLWTITCISGTGTSIYTKAIQAQAGRIRLDVSDLPPGLYLFRLNGTQVKIMKE